jgi:hypothetical protein
MYNRPEAAAVPGDVSPTPLKKMVAVVSSITPLFSFGKKNESKIRKQENRSTLPQYQGKMELLYFLVKNDSFLFTR